MPLSLLVWRDSVCAGDDADAPHPITLSLAPLTSLSELLDRLAAARYLPSIAGGDATWILEGHSPLAVLAQQWEAPRFLVDPALPIARYIDPAAEPHLELRYWCQADPEQVFTCLQNHLPLPDKYGR